MTRLDDYADRYSFAALDRSNGILRVRLHDEQGPLRWTRHVHRELSALFADIAGDHETRVVILTGTGDEFCTKLGGNPQARAAAEGMSLPRPGFEQGGVPTDQWNLTYFEGKRLLNTLLDIEVPVISAINGPAHIHAELMVLSDVVLAAPHVSFQDIHMDGSLPSGSMVAGDGGHVVWPMLLGTNRGRYFLMTSQVLGVEEAQRLGVVNEIVPSVQLMDRADELARSFAAMPPLVTRYFRVLTTQPIKRALLDDLGYGLALEGLAVGAGRGKWDQSTPLTGERAE